MRRLRRIDSFVPLFLEMARKMAKCPVDVTDEPYEGFASKTFRLHRALPWRQQDALCLAITHAIGDYCREHWINCSFFVDGPWLREPVKRSHPAPRARRPVRTR